MESYRDKYFREIVPERDRVSDWKIDAVRRMPTQRRQTRIRLVDEADDTIGIIWTAPDADDEHIRSLIPAGTKAMVAKNIWPA